MNPDCGTIKIQDFQEIIKNFSKLKGYDQWLLAKMDWKQKCQEDWQKSRVSVFQSNKGEWHIKENRRKKYASITLEKSEERGCQEMTLFLVAPTQNGRVYREEEKGKFCGKLDFSKEQVLAYLEKVGDYNSIHREENGIVPGLLIFQGLWEKSILGGLPKREFHVEMQWKAPLRIGEMCEVFSLGQGKYFGSCKNQLLWMVECKESS